MSETMAAQHEWLIHGAGGGWRLDGAGARVTLVLLRMMRACGVAPVTFERQGSATVVHISRKYVVLAHVFAFLVGLMMFVQLILDISLEAVKKEHRKHQIAKLMINCVSYVLTSAIIVVSVVRGPAAIECMVSSFTRIQKINMSIENKPMSRKLEKLLNGLVAASIVMVIVKCVGDEVKSAREVYLMKKKWSVYILQKVRCIGFIVATLSLLQVTVMVTSTLWALKALNRSIVRLHARIQCYGGNREEGPLVDAVRRLSTTYASILDICGQINGVEGLMMLLLLLDCTFQFVVFGFFTKMSFFSTDTVGWRYAYLAVHAFSFLRIAICLIMLVDPCHRTHRELKRTQELISQALCAPPAALDGVSAVLLQFYGVTEPFRFVYTPMGTFKISSSVYTALIGGLTTLITIIINI